MRKVLLFTALGLLLAGIGAAYAADIPRQRDPVLPGVGFEQYPEPILVKVAQAGFKFLDYPIGARSASLAGAVSTVPGDAHSVFWNPAGLGFLKGGEAFGGYSKWIADIKYNYGGFAYNVNGVNAFGFGLMTVDNGTIQGTRINTKAPDGFQDTNTFKPKEYYATFAYARKVTDRFSVGGALKYAHQDLGQSNILNPLNQPVVVGNKDSKVAFDLGTYFNTGFRTVTLGVNVNNFAKTVNYQGENFELPRRVAFAFSADLLTLGNHKSEKQKLGFMMDVEKPLDFSERILTAVEYLYAAPKSPFGVALRVGYRFKHDTETYSVGAGLKFKTSGGRGISFDYAYKQFNKSYFSGVQTMSGSVMF
ncbi:MAG: PorV/PorQ family protein [Candidatus Latescibacteria bacterium]|nr:PorV/PorQ family protein [Candidatus Latescibacterota bacterium]